jgi:hypothetical protein
MQVPGQGKYIGRIHCDIKSTPWNYAVTKSYTYTSKPTLQPNHFTATINNLGYFNNTLPSTETG